MIYFLLFLSTAINVLLVWYIKKTVSILLEIGNRTLRMRDVLGEFKTHLGTVYKMPIFEGEQDLKKLLQHSKDVVEEIELYENTYTLLEDGAEEEDAEESEEKDQNNSYSKKEA